MGGAASAAASAAPKAQLRVVGLGDPVTDVVVNVDAAALQYLGLEPGSCTSVRGKLLGTAVICAWLWERRQETGRAHACALDTHPIHRPVTHPPRLPNVPTAS